MIEAARRLGLTNCRVFTEWKSIEPGPKHYALQHWDRFFEAAMRNGIETTMTIYDPPAWVMPKGQTVGYQMFDCNLDAFREMVTTVSTRYKGKLAGWEWLNEITPGGPPDYVADYVKFCRAGVEAARAVDPGLRSVLAGGLWPRGFRLEVLNAGAGKYVDALPIHYGNGAGIQEAREDLDAYGCPRVAVWENESMHLRDPMGLPGAGMGLGDGQVQLGPLAMGRRIGRRLRKADLLRRRGRRDRLWRLPAGRFHAPAGRRHAGRAGRQDVRRQAGRRFFLAGQAGLFHLFERDGKPILIASSSAEPGEEVSLAVGTQSVAHHRLPGQRDDVTGRQ